MTAADPDRVRAEVLEGWERMAPRWRDSADELRAAGMPVATWLIDALHLQPGQRVLELAAGPGDTGFLAAELIAPGGTLISSDGAAAMVDVARERAARMQISNVEFKQLSLEWIDLPTADVDGVLCRWGLMFALDPGAALREMRRVLRPGGRVALACWDLAEHNPWMTIPRQALTEAGLLEPPDPALPGPFTLAAPGLLEELLAEAGFIDVVVERVEVERRFPDVEAYMAATAAISSLVAQPWAELNDAQRAPLLMRVAELTEPYTGPEGLVLPGRSHAAAADA